MLCLLLGDLLIILAQIICAIQFVYEEKFIKRHNFAPLLVVGLEGLKNTFAVNLSICSCSRVVSVLARTVNQIMLEVHYANYYSAAEPAS